MKISSSKEISALKPKEKRYSVAIENGLTIRVHPSGSKSWLIRVSQNGRNVDITLGRFPDISFAQAKQAARRKQKEFDVKPIGGYTLKDAFVLWCNLKRGRIVSFKDEKKRIEFYIMRHIGSRQLDEITAPLVIKTVQVIERDGKQSTLKRILMRLREIMELAVCAGYIDTNPLHRVSRVFAPARSTAMPSVDWRDLPSAMRIIKDAPIRMQNYFLFSLCSMLRPGEVAKLEKSWIINDVIHIPASEMKKGRSHRVPITSLMKELLKREKMLSPHPKNKYVFAGRASNGHISKQALAKWLHSSGLKGQLVAHGLRSIARCWMADNGVNFEIAEACLSHVVGDHVYRAYQRSDFLESRRNVMERWCSYVLFCAASAGIMTDFAMPTGDLAVSGTKMALCWAPCSCAQKTRFQREVETPNISGIAWVSSGYGLLRQDADPSGCFSTEGDSNPSPQADYDYRGTALSLSASRSSNIYKDDGTLQPSALRVLSCIRF